MNHNPRRRAMKLGMGFLLSGLLGGMAGAQTPKPPETPPSPVARPAASGPTGEAAKTGGKIILKVGDQQFTQADIDLLIASLPPQAQQAIATRGKKEVGDWYARVVMLAQQARLHHLDESPDFTQRLAILRTQLEAQAAGEEMNKQSKVSPEEIQRYYDTHSADFDQISLRQIIVRKRPAAPLADPARPNPSMAQGLSPEDAKNQAEAIRKELVAGTDIKKVSEDFNKPGEVIIEQEPRSVRRGAMRPEMEKVAFALKDGEVSEPVDVPQALVIFQVTGRSHVDLRAASPDIEKILQQQKVQAAMEAVKKNTVVWMDNTYFTGPSKPSETPAIPAPIGNTPPKQ